MSGSGCASADPAALERARRVRDAPSGACRGKPPHPHSLTDPSPSAGAYGVRGEALHERQHGASLFARGEGGYAARKPDLRRQARFGRPSRVHGTANAAAGTGRAKALRIARECGRSGASPEGWDNCAATRPAL